MYWSRLLRNSQRFGWKQSQPESPVSFSSAPVLLWQDCDYRGSDSSALPAADLCSQQLVSITSVEITLAEGVSLGATNSFSWSLRVFTNSNILKKKCFPPPPPFNTVWTKLLILGMQHKSLSCGIQVRLFSKLVLEVLLNLFEIQWHKSETAFAQISNHSQGDTPHLRSVPPPQIPVIISTYLHHWLCVWKRGSVGLSVQLLRTDQETRNKQD